LKVGPTDLHENDKRKTHPHPSSTDHPSLVDRRRNPKHTPHVAVSTFLYLLFETMRTMKRLRQPPSALHHYHHRNILLLSLIFVASTFCTSSAWDIQKDQNRHNILSSHNTLMESKKFAARPALAQSSSGDNINDNDSNFLSRPSPTGRLEELKQQEAELARQLAAIRMEKLDALRSRPLTIGIIGFGRFGQFIARTFSRHGKIVVTSRSDYTDIANGMSATYVPLDDPDSFLEKELDVIIMAVSILSFESTIKGLVPSLQKHVAKYGKGPLLVDVLSVKEHARQIMLQHLPAECDIMCTHPMFGPDSGRNGWHNLKFVYEKTRVDKVVFDPEEVVTRADETFKDTLGAYHSIHEDSEAHVESMDRIERFLSIWEEEGCRMVPMSCKAHDEYAANSQFITHLMGRILGAQGLSMTPIDTKGFESVLQLVDTTTEDSFELFYGLYKYNTNSMATIEKLKAALDNVVTNLKKLELEDKEKEKSKEEANILHN
jgi:arogenate dehydrogenase (NADP+)